MSKEQTQNDVALETTKAKLEVLTTFTTDIYYRERMRIVRKYIGMNAYEIRVEKEARRGVEQTFAWVPVFEGLEQTSKIVLEEC